MSPEHDYFALVVGTRFVDALIASIEFDDDSDIQAMDLLE